MRPDTELSLVKGVGPKTSQQLAAAGLKTVDDLVNFLPRKHEDYSQLTPIADLAPGKVTIKARPEKISTRPVRRGLRITTATLADESGKVQAVWFNQPYRSTQLGGTDQEFFFSGEFEFNYNRYQLTNPSVEKVSDMPVQTDRLLPVYRSVKGLKSQIVRKLLAELKPLMSMWPESLPEWLVKEQDLVSHSQALLGMHFPASPKEVELARHRLAFEEVFELLLAAQLNKQLNSKLEGWSIPFDLEAVKKFVGQLPFELTDAQRLAAWQVIQDFESATPMNRLLQGD